MSFKLATPPKSVGEYIDRVFKESSDKLALARAAALEKEKQKKTVQNVAQEKKEPLKEEDAPAPSPAPASPSPSDEDKKAMEEGDIQVGDIVEKLNAIRAGRSFRDEKIAAELEKYFTGLDKAEQVALFAYLKGIQEIVSGVGEGDKAVEPSDPAPAVEMHREPKQKTVSVKPTIIYKAGGDSAKKPSAEDTTAPAPIMPKTK